MMELDNLPPDLLMARGKYATIRSAHEDAKKRMGILCGSLSATASQILRAVQPDNDAIPDYADVDSKIQTCNSLVYQISECAAEIAELAGQRAALKVTAWGKPSRRQEGA